MKMLSGFKSSRLNGVIRTVLISVATFLLIFVLILAGISPDTYDIHVGSLPARPSTPPRTWRTR